MTSFEHEPEIRLEDVCDKIREHGIDHLDAQEQIAAWLDQGQGKVDANPTVEARIEFEIRRAELGRAAKDLEGTVRALEDALTIAEEERHDGLREKISAMLKELEGIDAF